MITCHILRVVFPSLSLFLASFSIFRFFDVSLVHIYIYIYLERDICFFGEEEEVSFVVVFFLLFSLFYSFSMLSVFTSCFANLLTFFFFWGHVKSKENFKKKNSGRLLDRLGCRVGAVYERCWRGQDRTRQGQEKGRGRVGRCRAGRRDEGKVFCVIRCVCARKSVRRSEFDKLVCLVLAPAMASSGVDSFLADCLAMGQEVSERGAVVPEPLRASGKSDTSVPSRVCQAMCWNRVS